MLVAFVTEPNDRPHMQYSNGLSYPSCSAMMACVTLSQQDTNL